MCTQVQKFFPIFTQLQQRSLAARLGTTSVAASVQPGKEIRTRIHSVSVQLLVTSPDSAVVAGDG